MAWNELFGQTRRTFLKAALAVGVLRSTSRTTAQTQINAEITDIEVYADRVTYGDTVPADVTIRNTGATEANFFVDYNVVAPGEDDPFPRRVDGEDGAETTLASGDEATVTVEWDVDDDASTGSYDIYVAVYDQSAQSDITVPLDEATLRNAFELRESGSEIDATINEFETDGGNVVVGETVESTVTVENTGDVEHTFYVGYSMYAHADGEAYSEGVTGTSITLEPGEEEAVTVSWTAPEDAPTGPYDAATVVWEESSIDELDTQLDRAENEAAIYLEGTEIEPTASFDILTENPIVGEEVEFDASDSEAPDGTIEEYRWDVTGDGEIDFIEEEDSATHVFDEATEYTVTLTVIDSNNNENSQTQTISILEPANPVADFDVSPEEPTVGEQVTFDASESAVPDGTITTYIWDFNGEEEINETEEITFYTFDETGDYTVTLTVVDSHDNEDRTEQTLQVDPGRFENLKERKRERATRIDDISVTDLGDQTAADDALKALTTAVENEEISRQVAADATDRLVMAENITDRTLTVIGPAEHRLTGDVDFNLAEATAQASMQTATSLAFMSLSMSHAFNEFTSELSEQTLPYIDSDVVEMAVEGALSMLEGAIDTAIEWSIGHRDDVNARDFVERNAADLFRTVTTGTVPQPRTIMDGITAASATIADQLTTRLRRDVEQSQYDATLRISDEGSLVQYRPNHIGRVGVDASLETLHTELSPGVIAENDGGLHGDMESARTARITGSDQTENFAQRTQTWVDAFGAASAELSLFQSVVDLLEAVRDRSLLGIGHQLIAVAAGIKSTIVGPIVDLAGTTSGAFGLQLLRKNQVESIGRIILGDPDASLPP